MSDPLTALATAASVYGATKGSGDKTTQSSTVDPASQARYDDLYNRAKGVAGQPFTPYTGARVAGFNPDQLAGFDATRNMFGRSLSFDPTGQLNNLAQGPLDIQQFQNPYNDQVINNTLSDLNDARQMQIQSDQDAAIGRGAFGGSRSALLESETNKKFADVAGRTAGNLRQSGFNNAANLAMGDRNFRAGLFGNQLADQYRGLGLLSGIGRQQQALGQAGLDANYNEFTRGINYGPEQLGLLSGAVFGMTPGQINSTSNKQGTLGRIGDSIDIYDAIKNL
ncbi:protein of unknown function [uncultured Mediterranean phage uvMED]|nr:protein of unknown function [uncultured Mediterranean phage uvMED]